MYLLDAFIHNVYILQGNAFLGDSNHYLGVACAMLNCLNCRNAYKLKAEFDNNVHWTKKSQKQREDRAFICYHKPLTHIHTAS